MPLGVLLLLLLLLTSSGIGIEVTQQSSFCGSCHSMKQVYATWKKSTHQEMPCVACHIDPGFQGFVYAKLVLGPRDVLSEVIHRPTPEEIEKLHLQFQDAQCERCHRGILRINEKPPEDLPGPVKEVGLKYSHKKHKEAKVLCMDCHLDAVHGTPAKYPTLFPLEKQCLTCHGKGWKDGKIDPLGEIISKRCSVCHQKDRIRKYIWENPVIREGFEDTMEEELREIKPEEIGKGYQLDF